jgi:hypothetical protein
MMLWCYVVAYPIAVGASLARLGRAIKPPRNDVLAAVGTIEFDFIGH